jgi:pimeloyl-ACP methyl ester carboxylesterase
MGASMGGMIVQEFALRHPERVASLIVGCSTAGGRHVISPPQEVIQTLFQGAGEGAPEDSANAAIEILVHPESLTRRSQRVKFYAETKRTHPHSGEELMRRATGVAKHDTFDRLSGLSVPTLVLTGSHDRLVPKENSALIAGQIPDAKLVEINEAGHLFFVEQPEETTRAIREFLSQQAEL